MRRISVLGFGILGLALIGCRSSSGGGTGDDDTTVDAPAKQTIQDVQNDAMPVGTPVALDGVIVTAIDAFGAKTGDFWIEEPGGGPFSGVHVFGAPTASVAALQPGDIISLSGAVKDEFALSTDTSGRTVTELEAPKGGTMTITKTGNGTVPAPAVVDALMIGQLAAQADRDAQWEMWEGVLITIDKVTALNAPKEISGSNPDPTLQSFNVTGQLVAESSIAAFPTPIAPGDCLGSITGVVDYFFNYEILPRTTADMTTGGTGCPARETAVGGDGTLCTDGIDNDGNGFSDCNDLGCEVGPTAWLGTTCTSGDAMCGCSANLPVGTSVNKVATQTNKGPVIVNNAFVTAVGKNGFWVADALAAAQSHGAFVFLGSGVSPAASIVIGAQPATVQGISGPFTLKSGGQALNEVSSATVGTVTAPGAAPTPLAATVTDVGDIVNGAPFSGVLVQLTNLKVTTAPVGGKGKATLTDNAGKTIQMSDFAFGPATGNGYGGVATALNTCYSTIVGVMDMDTTNQIRTFNPRIVADMTVGTGCN